jgi:hypothetical protein
LRVERAAPTHVHVPARFLVGSVERFSVGDPKVAPMYVAERLKGCDRGGQVVSVDHNVDVDDRLRRESWDRGPDVFDGC